MTTEKPEIKKGSLLLGSGRSIEISYFMGPEGKYLAHREEVQPVMGKRYTCAHPISPETQGGAMEYKGGVVRLDNGDEVNLGCKTETMCMKQSPKPGAPHCCDMSLSRMEDRKLPSSD